MLGTNRMLLPFRRGVLLKHIMRICFLLVSFILVNHYVNAASPISVKVGGYPFEPFVEGNFGVTPGFITLLNSNQDIYRFEFVPIPAQRRYEMIADGKIDALFFEMQRWGWQDKSDNIEFTRPIIAGREVFVTLKDNPNSVSILADPTKHSMALTLGYHYAFAGFKADQTYLQKAFNVQFAEKQRIAIKYLLAGRTDVAMASEIFLHHEYLRDTELQQKLEISDRMDQHYELPLMVRKGGKIDIAVMNRILDGLVDCNCLTSFFSSYGLEKLLVYQPD